MKRELKTALIFVCALVILAGLQVWARTSTGIGVKVTMAEVLSDAGSATSVFAKWHLVTI